MIVRIKCKFVGEKSKLVLFCMYLSTYETKHCFKCLLVFVCISSITNCLYCLLIFFICMLILPWLFMLRLLTLYLDTYIAMLSPFLFILFFILLKHTEVSNVCVIKSVNLFCVWLLLLISCFRQHSIPQVLYTPIYILLFIFH